MGIRAVSLLLCLACSGASGAGSEPEEERPNLLLLVADDLLCEAVGAWGSKLPEATPHIDALAAEGLRFTRAHVVIASCKPSRDAILTGRYPHLVSDGGFGDVHGDTPTLPALLSEAGYRTGVLGKAAHMHPHPEVKWDLAIEGQALAEGRSHVEYLRHVRSFLDTDADKPFFLVVNTHDPHRPFYRAGDVKKASDPKPTRPSRVYKDEEAEVPGFLPDLPEIRTEMARYASSVRRADDIVGVVLDELKERQLDSSTLVIFLSDHGPPLPFAKSNVFPASTRTPLIVRWPGRTATGGVEDRLVSSLDLFPTLLAAAGVVPTESNGRDLAPLIAKEEELPWREHLFTQFHQTITGTKFPMRAVITRDHHYIFNAWSNGQRQFRSDSMNGLAWGALRGSEAHSARRDHYLMRAPEELYDLGSDPSALENLAGSDAATLGRMREALRKWMEAHEDPLLETYEQRIGH